MAHQILDRVNQDCCRPCFEKIRNILDEIMQNEGLSNYKIEHDSMKKDQNSRYHTHSKIKLAHHASKHSRTSQNTAKKSDKHSPRSSVMGQPHGGMAGNEIANHDPTILLSNFKKSSAGQRRSFILSQSCNSGGHSARSGRSMNGSRGSRLSRKSSKRKVRQSVNHLESKNRNSNSPIQLFTNSSHRLRAKNQEDDSSCQQSPAIPFTHFQNRYDDTTLKIQSSRDGSNQQIQI